MIVSYQLKKLENDEVGLFLYMDEDFEFSHEFFSKFRKFNLKSFMNKKGLDLNGCKVFLVVGGVVMALIYSPVVGKEDNRFPLFVNQNTLFLEQVDVGKQESKLHELVWHLNHFLESSSIAKVNEDEIINNYVEEKIEDDKGEIEGNKELVGNNNTSNNANKNNSSNTNNYVDEKNQNNSSNNQLNTSNSNQNQSGIKEENKNEVPNEEIKEEEKEESIASEMMVEVHRSNGEVLHLEMEEYLIGVVASEMPASFHLEALKVQSILARTYAMKRIESGEVLTDTVKTQRYMDKDEMRKMWGSGFDKYYQKVKNAVDLTKGQVVLHDGILIDAVYHSTSNGKTEDSVSVWGNAFPYLVSVDSSWDKNVNGFFKVTSFTLDKLCSIFGLSREEFSFEIITRNQSGRVETVEVGGKIYSGVQVRAFLGLRSADFEFFYEGEQVIFETKGYGHGVGLSQYGANEMAKMGSSYDNIIKHYYKGVNIRSISI